MSSLGDGITAAAMFISIAIVLSVKIVCQYLANKDADK